MSLPSYAVDFRGLPACPCQAEWIPAFEQHLQFLGIFAPHETLILDQLIGSFSASSGTHDDGGVSDFGLFGHTADLAVGVARQMGADATWHREAGWNLGSGVEHVHSVLRGCPHLAPLAVIQIEAVERGGDGLVGDAPDNGPRPLSYRTWREGIAWAQEQEDDMPAPKDWDAEDWAAIQRHLPSTKQIANAVWAYAVNNAGTKAKAVLALLWEQNAPKTDTKK